MTEEFPQTPEATQPADESAKPAAEEPGASTPVKEAPKETPKSPPKGREKESPPTPKEAPKETPKEAPKETPKESPKGERKSVSVDEPMGSEQYANRKSIPFDPIFAERKEASNAFFNGKKHRRESSASKIFYGDHMGVLGNPELDVLLGSFTPTEEFFFADHCTRLTNRNHMDDCCVIVTSNYVLVLNNRMQHLLTNGPIPIRNIIKLGTSLETDNAVVIYLPEYQSELLMTSFKVELMQILMERYFKITETNLEVTFGNVIEIEVAAETIFEFDFVRANDGILMTLFVKAKPGAPLRN